MSFDWNLFYELKAKCLGGWNNREGLFRYLDRVCKIALSFIVIQALENRLNLPSPLQRIFIEDNPCESQVYIKRDDLIHPFVSGNKWRKLKYNLIHALQENYAGILSFGGAFSNHLYALSYAARELGIKAAGIIRGDGFDPNNYTLGTAKSHGMELHFVSRTEYGKNLKSGLIQEICSHYSDFFIIPEGGSNDHALIGVEELGNELKEQISGNIDYVVLAVGTGATIYGLSESFTEKTTCIGIPVLKAENILPDMNFSKKEFNTQNTVILDRYHFGGYAKYTRELVSFVNQFYKSTHIPLDMVYTAKAMYALFDLLANSYFEKGSTVEFIHTGGMQGNQGFNYRNPGLLDFHDVAEPMRE